MQSFWFESYNPRKPNKNKGKPRKKDPNQLTRREREVLQAMADGLSNKLIADKLGIAEDTAKFHVYNTIRKMGATVRSGAVAQGFRQGIIV